jgi:hypothetical protein
MDSGIRVLPGVPIATPGDGDNAMTERTQLRHSAKLLRSEGQATRFKSEDSGVDNPPKSGTSNQMRRKPQFCYSQFNNLNERPVSVRLSEPQEQWTT